MTAPAERTLRKGEVVALDFGGLKEREAGFRPCARSLDTTSHEMHIVH